ncbi:MAG: PAS domain S-box protein [Methanosarcinales archaeon]|nr:PAS domain S-box protein [Methanosarcinales archaeon]
MQTNYIPILRLMRDPACLCDADHCLLYLNSAAEQLSGWDEKDLRGRKISVLLEEGPRALEKDVPRPVTILRKDGTAIQGTLRTTPLQDGDGWSGTLAILEPDVENETVALGQGERPDSISCYKAAVLQSRDAIFVINPWTRALLEANPAFYQLLGYNSTGGIHHRAAGLRMDDFVMTDPEVIEGYVRQVVENGSLYLGEQAYRCLDGSLVNVDVSSRLAVHGGREALCFVVREIAKSAASNDEVSKRDGLLAGVAVASNLLLTSREFDEGVNQALEVLGASAGADRIYIFENKRDHETGQMKAVRRYRWEAETKESLQNDVLYYEVLPRWWDRLSQNKPVYGLVQDFPHSEQRALDPSIVSILAFPIFIEEEFWGFIAVDDCRAERKWTWSEVSILLAAGASIGGAVARRRAEENLMQSEEEYRQLVEDSNSIILRMDPTGSVTFLNEFGQRFFGYSEGEILGKNVIGMIVPEMESSGRDLKLMIDDLLENPDLYLTHVNENMRKNRERVWILWTNRPVLDENGRLVELLCIGNDITDNKLAEERLKEANRKLLDIIDFLPDATLVIDSEKRVIAWNRVLEEMTGVMKSEIIGKGDYAYSEPFHGMKRPMLIDLIDNFDEKAEANYPNLQRMGDTLYAQVFVPSLFNGVGAYLWAKASPLLDREGNVVGAIESMRDITLSVMAERELQISEERLRAIVESARDSIFIKDRDMKYVQVNRAMSELFDLPSGMIIGKTDRDLFGPKAAAAMESVDLRVLKGEVVEEEPAKMVNGQPLTFHTIKVPLRDDKNNVVGICGIARDITERKSAEDELRKRDRLLEGAADVANRLITGKDFDSAIQESLMILGQSSQADRVYVFENHTDPQSGDLLLSCRYHWLRSGLSSRIDDSALHDLSFREALPSWHKVLSAGNPIKGHVRDFPEHERAYFQSRDVASMLIFPIIAENVFWGFVGLDTEYEREWAESECSILSAVAGSIGAALIRKKGGERLRLLESAVVNANDGVLIAVPGPDADHLSIIYANEAISAMSGYSQEEIVGKRLGFMAGPATDQAELDRITQARSGNRPVSVELVSYRKDGSTFWAEVNMFPVMDEDGSVTHWVSLHRDATERRREEQALKETRNYLESLINYANAPITVWDASFQITRFNRAFERLTGHRAEDVVGRHLSMLFPESSRAVSLDKIERTLQGETWESVEIPILRKDGETRYVLWNSANIYAEDGTTLVATMAQGTDITERKIAEKQVVFQANLLSQVRNHVVATDLEGNIVYWNDYSETLFGWSAKEVMGKSILDTVVPDYRAEAARQVLDHLLQYGHYESEQPARKKDGTIFPVYYVYSVIRNPEGEVSGFLGVGVDMTERVKAEEELRAAKDQAEVAARAKAEFLANMSHEIRTPLNAVVGLTGLMLGTPLSLEQRDYMETIRQSSDTLLEIINNILDFSKIDGGKLDLELQPFDLRECVETSLDLVAADASEKRLDLAYLMEGVPESLVGDVTRVRQVLANFLSNAVKFTRKGEVSVQVTGERQEDGRYRVHFAVKDTGLGIPEDRMSRLFQSFSQLDSSITRRYGGTGLGLAISKRLVEMMDGGRIWADSRPGQGATFHFAITAEEGHMTSRMQMGPQPYLEGRKVLVVSSNRTLKRSLARQMEAWHMQPSAAASEEEAFSLVDAGQSFDLVILDMQQPDVKARERLQRFVHHPSLEKQTFLLLTYLNSRDLDSLDQPSCWTLSKPLKISQLYDFLAHVFTASVSDTSMKSSSWPELPAPQPLRILLAEDNLVNQKVALTILTRLGYTADVAADGYEVIRALERQPYDVVLMDVQMPDMDGLEAARRIRKRWPGSPYIIATTAYALKGDRETCLEAGMDDYISKPIQMEDLQMALWRSLGRVDHRTPVESPLDQRSLDRLRELQVEGEPEIIHELADLFLSHAPARIQAIIQAVEQRDADALLREAHSLKSSSANMGALRLSELSRQLEVMGRSSRMEGAKEKVEELGPEFRRVEVALASLKREGSPGREERPDREESPSRE